ncbi:hypothetical protein NPIL_644291, partial [Nephila pilipes]
LTTPDLGTRDVWLSSHKANRRCQTGNDGLLNRVIYTEKEMELFLSGFPKSLQ